MAENEVVEDAIDEQYQAAHEYFEDRNEAYHFFNDGRLNKEIGKVTSTDPQRVKLQVEKALLVLFKRQLTKDPNWNQRFRRQTGWAVLDQLLTVVRLQELAAAKITKKGGRGAGLRYDIGELMNTYYGKSILEGLGLKRRRVATSEELDTIRAALKKIKLELPEVIEPTTTERFFAGEEIA